jgi:hypothetical protein
MSKVGGTVKKFRDRPGAVVVVEGAEAGAGLGGAGPALDFPKKPVFGLRGAGVVLVFNFGLGLNTRPVLET